MSKRTRLLLQLAAEKKTNISDDQSCSLNNLPNIPASDKVILYLNKLQSATAKNDSEIINSPKDCLPHQLDENSTDGAIALMVHQENNSNSFDLDNKLITDLQDNFLEDSKYSNNDGDPNSSIIENKIHATDSEVVPGTSWKNDYDAQQEKAKIIIIDHKIFLPREYPDFASVHNMNNKETKSNNIESAVSEGTNETEQTCSTTHVSETSVSDFIPSSPTSDANSSFASEEISDQNVKTKIGKAIELEEPAKKETKLQNLHQKQMPNKDLCPFCFEEVGHFSRHLFRKHQDEEQVKKIIKLPLKSQERRMAFIGLKRKGNFIWKQEHKQLKTVRKPSRYTSKYINEDYYPCVYCLGYFKKSYLWRHKKTCHSNISESLEGKQQHLTESQTFLACTGLLGNFLNKSRLKTEVFSVMRADKISFTAKTDPLICLYGESYLSKHKRTQMNVVVSNKMREMARLKIAFKNFTTIDQLIDILKPEMYDYIVAACKIIAGYNPEIKSFKASSVALNMGNNLKFICDVAKKALLTKKQLFSFPHPEEKLKEIVEVRDIINNHWCNDVASLANKVLHEKRSETPKLLPVTEDIKKFNNYIIRLAHEACDNLTKGLDIPHNYKQLCECTLALVLVFNRKRIGEVQFLHISAYEKISVINQEESLSSLTELEKRLCLVLKRVIVFGKGSKPVPILFTKKMQEFIKILLKIRRATKIVPESNQYIFANPGSIDRWMSGPGVLRKFANKCGAQNPELLTSTRFRKQIATILQLVNFEQDEMEQIAKFMGHTEKTHKEFYRLTEDIYQTAKVAKILLLLNAGRGIELKGKSLNEIEIDDEYIEEDEGEFQNEKELKKNSQKELNESIEMESSQSTFHKNSCDNEASGHYSFKHRQVKEMERAVGTEMPLVTIKHNAAEMEKGRRIRWTSLEKDIVLQYFKKHINDKIAPKKEECLTFIQKNSKLFNENHWVRIKTLVYNTYRNK